MHTKGILQAKCLRFSASVLYALYFIIDYPMQSFCLVEFFSFFSLQHLDELKPWLKGDNASYFLYKVEMCCEQIYQ